MMKHFCRSGFAATQARDVFTSVAAEPLLHFEKKND
jgi:hypothetical protein